MSPEQQVRVYVSTGQETATVPTLVGLAQDAATARARRRSGSSLGTVTPRNDPALAAGTVISADQAEPARGPARHGGQPRRRRPGASSIIDVTGYTVDAATRELEDPESQLVVIDAGGHRRARRPIRRP